MMGACQVIENLGFSLKYEGKVLKSFDQRCTICFFFNFIHAFTLIIAHLFSSFQLREEEDETNKIATQKLITQMKHGNLY